MRGENYGDDGNHFIKNYTPDNYSCSDQNWSILQHPRQLIYAGNNGGLLEFDGVSWRVIHVPNWSVLSTSADDNGTIYVGGKNEMGFLTPGSDGELHYTSLMNHLTKDQRNFSNVWGTHTINNKTWFRSLKYLFKWDPKKKSNPMTVWHSDNYLVASFACGDELFIRQQNVGLVQMINDTLTPVPKGETFAEKKIYAIMRYGTDSRKFLIGTRSNGFYLYDGHTVTPFPTEADDYVTEKQLSHGIRLKSGDFALGTRLGGIVIIDSHGKQKHIFDKSTGLQDQTVRYILEDSQRNLWIALNKGITKIEYGSPFSIYNEQKGLPGIVLSVTGHYVQMGPHSSSQQVIYAGTTNGLFKMEVDGMFRPVPQFQSGCRSLLSVHGVLLAASDSGIYRINTNSTRMIVDSPSDVLYQSIQDPNRIWAGTRNGLVSLYNSDRGWTLEHSFKSVTQPIRTIVEDQKGDLWLGTLTKGILRVTFSGAVTNSTVTTYHEAHGLPKQEVHVFKAAGHVMFATEKGIFRFDDTGKTFIPDETLGKEFADGTRNVFRIVQDKDKHIWFHSQLKNYHAVPQRDGTFKVDSVPFLRIPKAQINAIYPVPEKNTVWFAGNDGLIRFDTVKTKNYSLPYPCLIRRVQLLDDKMVRYNAHSHPVLAYKDRSLRIQFAAPFFEAESETTYQYFLEGYDVRWSTWSSETQKDYTNLDAGSYTFWVRAKNIYGHFSEKAVFPFEIMPPWYGTWWARVLFVLALLLFMLLFTFLVVKLRSRQLKKEKQILEQIVHERTKEIETKNQQLETQTLQLKDQSKRLQKLDQVKSRFFANISHEFRTPLTLIMGPLEQILSDSGETQHQTKADLQKKARMMMRNSQRLLHLINELLELSKLDSGEVVLKAAHQDVIPFLKGIIASFEPAADQHDLSLVFDARQESVFLYFEAEKMEEVLINLLSNAVKFTPAGGRITVTANATGNGTEDFPDGTLDISICDTGPGIPREQLDRIFDRFYQADSTYEHHRKGSGIGLAIAKELVEFHGGTIAVRSGGGNGTEFTVRLPLGRTHLKPEEIIETSTEPYQYKEVGKIHGEEEPSQLNEIQDKVIDIDAEAEDQTIILVVEDSNDVREYIRGALEPVYRVIDAIDGKDGIEKAKAIIPDLIISDIMMPGVEGDELCRILKKDVHTSHIPIILLTAKAGEKNIIEGLETGADDYITKPFNTRILSARIKNLIDIRSQLQQNMKREMTLQPIKMSVSEIDREFLRDLQAVINKNIADPEFNVDELSRKLYMGRSTLYRKIHALSGETPKEFIRSYRLKRGAELLKNKAGSVVEVSFEVGFSSSSYFAKCFKEKFQMLPTEYLAANGDSG